MTYDTFELYFGVRKGDDKSHMRDLEFIKARIETEYNYFVLIRECILIVAIYIYHITFPEAFELLQYPFYLLMSLVLLNLIIFLPVYITVKRLKGDLEVNHRKILKIDKSFFFLNNYTIALLIPAFGSQFINIFWFVTAINFCVIFASPYNRGRKMLFVYFAPFISYVIHSLIYLLSGKGFYAIEGGFALLMCIVFYYTHLTINKKRLYDKLIGNSDILFERFGSAYNLTDREREILGEIFKGKQNKQIGESLFISAGTVRNHLSNIFLKTGTHSRMELFSAFNNFNPK